MVKGMARAARVFDRPDWLASARAATDFVRATLWRADGERTERASACSHLQGWQGASECLLDDYAFLLDALIEFDAKRIAFGGPRLGARDRRSAARSVRGP